MAMVERTPETETKSAHRQQSANRQQSRRIVRDEGYWWGGGGDVGKRHFCEEFWEVLNYGKQQVNRVDYPFLPSDIFCGTLSQNSSTKQTWKEGTSCFSQ